MKMKKQYRQDQVRDRDEFSILSEIEALHSDAMQQSRPQNTSFPKAGSERSPDTQPAQPKAISEVVSLEDILWSSDASDTLDAHQAEAVAQGKKSRSRLPESDAEFDRLLFKLMKDVNPGVPDKPHVRSAVFERKSELKKSGPVFDFSGASQQQPRQSPAAADGHENDHQADHTEEQPSPHHISQTGQPQQFSITLSNEMRAELSQFVYGLIEARLKGWVDRNIEQIVQDALRYSQTDSTDSH